MFYFINITIIISLYLTPKMKLVYDFGVVLELLFVESQQHYRYAIEPFYRVIAAFGYFGFSKL